MERLLIHSKIIIPIFGCSTSYFERCTTIGQICHTWNLTAEKKVVERGYNNFMEQYNWSCTSKSVPPATSFSRFFSTFISPINFPHGKEKQTPPRCVHVEGWSNHCCHLVDRSFVTQIVSLRTTKSSHAHLRSSFAWYLWTRSIFHKKIFTAPLNQISFRHTYEYHIVKTG